MPQGLSPQSSPIPDTGWEGTATANPDTAGGSWLNIRTASEVWSSTVALTGGAYWGIQPSLTVAPAEGCPYVAVVRFRAVGAFWNNVPAPGLPDRAGAVQPRTSHRLPAASPAADQRQVGVRPAPMVGAVGNLRVTCFHPSMISGRSSHSSGLSSTAIPDPDTAGEAESRRSGTVVSPNRRA